MDKITFDKLNLSKTTFDAITAKGFKEASEIQAKAIPVIFEQKNDIVGIAQTGTGKTGAFGLPLIDLIEEGNKLPQAIILAPTRELALQVTAELEMFSGKKKLNILTVYGGAPMQIQQKSLRRGVDIVVGTPGRVVDLIKRGDLKLEESKYFILDEADEMLKMGFIEDIELVLEASAKKRRVYLFSATMPSRIKQLSKKYMENQEIIEVKKKTDANPLIEQSFFKVKQSEKFDVLSKIIDFEDFFYGIVFCRTKADVDNVTQALRKAGHDVDCIHGDIAQNRREKILQKFRDLKLSILVATDVAARGIDVENLSHVINYNLPEDVETYTHRIGRTGRAGNKGKAISLPTPAEMRRITAIERTLKVKVQPMKLPSLKDVAEKKSKKFNVEIDGVIEKIDTSHHVPLADQLLEKHDPAKVISALLHKLYDNPSSKGSSSDSGSSKGSDHPRSRARNLGGGNTLRLFIAKGRMDKMDRKTLIRFLERETKVRIGDVEDVKVCEKFSFMTLDADEAHAIVEYFESQGKRRPLAEIAQN